MYKNGSTHSASIWGCFEGITLYGNFWTHISYTLSPQWMLLLLHQMTLRNLYYLFNNRIFAIKKLPYFSQMGEQIFLRCLSVFVILDLCKWFRDIFSRDVGDYIPHSSLMISFKSMALKVLLDWVRNEWPTSTGGPYQLCEGFGLVRNGWMNHIIDPLWFG